MNDTKLTGKSLLRPELRALPMGWNWAVCIARRITLEAVRRASGEVPMVLDRFPGIVLTKGDEVCATVCVGNYVILGHSKGVVDRARALLVEQPHSQQLTTRERVEAKEGAEFVALEITACPVNVRIKKFRG